MKERLKKIGRISLYAILWIFIFSIRIDGKTLFQYGHGVFVENRIVGAVDHQANLMWTRLLKTVRYSYHTMTGRDDSNG